MALGWQISSLKCEYFRLRFWESLEIVDLCDSDCQRDSIKRHCTSGFCFKISQNIFFVILHKQQALALSSTEADYICISSPAQECVYFYSPVETSGFLPKWSLPLYDDDGWLNLLKNQSDTVEANTLASTKTLYQPCWSVMSINHDANRWENSRQLDKNPCRSQAQSVEQSSLALAFHPSTKLMYTYWEVFKFIAFDNTSI